MKTTTLLLAAVTACLCLSDALARTPVPAPPPQAPENAIFQPDWDLPFTPGSHSTLAAAEAVLQRPTNPVPPGRNLSTGGTDIDIAQYPIAIYPNDLAVDSAGFLYAVNTVADEPLAYRLVLYRSTDGGATWSLWWSLSDPTGDRVYTFPCLHIAEGDEDQIFLAFKYREDGREHMAVARSPLGDTPAFSIATLDTTEFAFSVPSFTSDAAAFSGYYLYLTYSVEEDSLTRILFTRSIDLGETWEPPYSIASLNLADRGYYNPKVSYGYGGFVHVLWYIFFPDGTYDSALRYRRAPDYAGGGQAAWEDILGLTSLTNGVYERARDIHASLTTEQVVAGCRRTTTEGYGTAGQVVFSEDQGESWNGSVILPNQQQNLQDITQNQDNGDWYVCVDDLGLAGLIRASSSNLDTWSDHYTHGDEPMSHGAQLVLDPTHDLRPAFFWYSHGDPMGNRHLMFDADWRADPGVPNVEDGFPIDLPAQPISDPALADLDGDGKQEIIFGDNFGFVRIYRADGSVLPGWPVYSGTSLSDSPIAVADMNGDGTPIILAPSADGRVFGYRPDGSTAHGWPFDSGEDASASVNIGHLGPPYRYVAVVIAGSKMHFLTYQGLQVPGSFVWNNDSFVRGCAIGDHDNDGTNEVIFRAGSLVLGTEMLMNYTDLYRSLDEEGDTTPALADLDLDGNLEIVVTTPGQVHVLGDNGVDHPGWPRTFDAGIPLSDPAIAQVWSGFEPEIAVCSRDWKAALFQADGNMVPGYPVEPGGWYIRGNPVLGLVRLSPAVVFGARGSRGWAYRNNGDVVEGWPRVLSTHCELTPAMGDIDLDGRNEIIFLTLDQLVVVDVNTEPWSAVHNWLMTGHDPRRSGCSDCPDNLLTPVEEEPAAITHVRFAAPAPNPVTGRAAFQYAVPVRAVVELAVYDLRGRRVALLSREEVGPGPHRITWNGRDDSGRHLASGNYVAALRVRGPGVDEQLNRKVTILR